LFRVMRSAFVLFVLPIAFANGAGAQIGVPLNNQDPRLESIAARELVARYCRMDYAGARLNPSDWQKLAPLVSWRSDTEIPLMMVTSRFDVDANLALERGKYTVTVHYRLLGKYDMAEGYSQDSSNAVQNVHFVVSEVNGDWRITQIEPSYPHPSRDAILQWLNRKLAEAPDPAAKLTYQHAVQVLQPEKSSPAAK